MHVDGLPGFQVPSSLFLCVVDCSRPPSLVSSRPSLTRPLRSSPFPLLQYSGHEHRRSQSCSSKYLPIVCSPAYLPAYFRLSCRCVSRSSQLNESSRFARFGVLRRSPKARGTGSQSLQASMRPPNPAQPWNVLHYQPNLALRTTADGRSAPVPLPSLKNSKGCYLVPVSWQQTQSARLRDEPRQTELFRPLPTCRRSSSERTSDGRFITAPPAPPSLLVMPRGPGGQGNGGNFLQADPAGRYVADREYLATASRQDRSGTGTAQLRLTSALKSPPGCEPSLGAQTPV